MIFCKMGQKFSFWNRRAAADRQPAFLKYKSELPACGRIIHLFKKCSACTVCHIDIQFCNHFKRCMHAENRNSNINGVNVQISKISCNGTAAAAIYFAELSGLPYNIMLIQQPPNGAGKFCGSIRCAGLSSCAGELVGSNAALTSADRH